MTAADGTAPKTPPVRLYVPAEFHKSTRFCI